MRKYVYHTTGNSHRNADTRQVFVMRGTGEVFIDYETYIKRYDYERLGYDIERMLTLYRHDYLSQVSSADLPITSIMQYLTTTQKKFVDAVNGKSGLTYFDALESEVRLTYQALSHI